MDNYSPPATLRRHTGRGPRMYGDVKAQLGAELDEIRAAGLYKEERIICSPQGAEIEVSDTEVLNFCANNYLGLGDHPQIVEAAIGGLRSHGYGMSSVRFI